MDATLLARQLLEPVPATSTLGLEVLRAVDGDATVGLTVEYAQSNAIGALDAGGLVGLVDAAGLAAIVAACDDDAQARMLVPTACLAWTKFLAPARGRLVACCSLSDESRTALRQLLTGHIDRIRLTTDAVVTDADHATVCRGSFCWSIRSYARHDQRQSL
jgi:acyl-coenzyme A thioesterase PaaI-like protein